MLNLMLIVLRQAFLELTNQPSKLHCLGSLS
nr:MAG TPA: hypothetical protein [Caudoviricetes sp.]